MNNDAINPNHYKLGGKLEVIDVIEAVTKDMTGMEAVCTANALKYICRWKHKNGLEDLKKARWYLERLIGDIEKAKETKNEEESSIAPTPMQDPKTHKVLLVSDNPYGYGDGSAFHLKTGGRSMGKTAFLQQCYKLDEKDFGPETPWTHVENPLKEEDKS